MLNIGANIKAARKAQKITQKELAQKIDCATITIQQYEAGKRQPRVDKLLQISEILKTPIDFLISEQWEAVEYCAECETENVYPNKNVFTEGFVETCNECGKRIVLCDECYHVGDNAPRYCDWQQVKGKDYGTCWRLREWKY